jgi:hypothetical protein
MSKDTVKYIYGNPYLTSKHVEILQKYFKVDWKFAKSACIYYIDPESGIAMCKSASILYDKTSKYQFKTINVKTIKEYVNRLQKQETNLDRRDQQPTSGIQCTSSKASIASGHFEDRTINFRRRSKAKIGKANLSF